MNLFSCVSLSRNFNSSEIVVCCIPDKALLQLFFTNLHLQIFQSQ